MAVSRPAGLGPATSLRANRPHLHSQHSRGDRKSGRLAFSDRDGAVISCYVPADEWPGWTDAVTVSLAGGA